METDVLSVHREPAFMGGTETVYKETHKKVIRLGEGKG
jgi:hypothetical protein